MNKRVRKQLIILGIIILGVISTFAALIMIAGSYLKWD